MQQIRRNQPYLHNEAVKTLNQARRAHLPGRLVLSMREAVFIVSPNTLNLGSLVPMRPVTTGPVCIPTRTRVGLPSWGMGMVLEQRSKA